MNEIWKPVKDYEGLYEVSNWGRVRNVRTGSVLLPRKCMNGYLIVVLYKDGVRKPCYVHRLVAQAFPDMVGWTEKAVGKPFDELQINHKDEVKTNNRVENLEWCDGFYNQTYSRGKTVYMYTLSGGLCGLWPSTRECERNKFNQGAIAACCRGVKKQYKGFKWSYEPPRPPKALPCYDTDTPTSTSEVPMINEYGALCCVPPASTNTAVCPASI